MNEESKIIVIDRVTRLACLILKYLCKKWRDGFEEGNRLFRYSADKYHKNS